MTIRVSHSVLTATAIAALLGFGGTAALAQQSGAKLEPPAIEKAAPAVKVHGKAEAQQSTAQPAATTAKRAAAKAKSGATGKPAAAVCDTIKDDAAKAACLDAHVKNQAAKTGAKDKSDAPQRAATRDAPKAKSKAPATGG